MGRVASFALLPQGVVFSGHRCGCPRGSMAGDPSPWLPPGFSFENLISSPSKEGKWNISFSGVCLFVLLSSVVNRTLSNYTSEVSLNHDLEPSRTRTNAWGRKV